MSKSQVANGSENSSNLSKYSKLQLRISQYLRSFAHNGGVETGRLLNEFNDVPDQDAAIFKRLLNNVGYKESGKWFLKNTS